MSAVKFQLADFRRDGEPFSGPWPTTADSYNPVFATPQGKYGSCTATGGVLRINNCNYQQQSAIPLVLPEGNACVCMLPDGRTGCFDNDNEKCLN